MATDAYLTNVIKKPFFADEARLFGPLAKKHFWIHNHPTTIKIIKIATYILSFSMTFVFPAILYSTSLVVPIASIVIGGVICLANYIFHKVINTIASKHDMKTHVFKPAKVDGAKLYYAKDVPILSIETTNHYKAGYAHGYLLGKNIDILRRRLNFADKLPFLSSHVTEDKVPNVLKEIQKTIPDEYLKEMRGLVDGFNKWASKKFYFLRPKKMTLNELILFNLIPDSTHFYPESVEERENFIAQARVACTVCVDGDIKGIAFGRNMDWASYGVAGAHSLIIKRKTSSVIKTADVAIPGLVGVLTGMNSHGLSLAMNTSCKESTDSIRGMPAIFLNRYCLENAIDVDHSKELIDNKRPLGPYHLTLADSEKAHTFHFYQGPVGTFYGLRKFAQEKPLIVTNGFYDEDLPNLYSSDYRVERLKSFFKDVNSHLKKEEVEMDKIVAKSLTLPYVNNSLTTHSVVMRPKLKEMQVSFDNAYSANNILHRLTQRDLFS